MYINLFWICFILLHEHHIAEDVWNIDMIITARVTFWFDGQGHYKKSHRSLNNS